MTTATQDSPPIFYAEGDDAAEYLRFMEDRGEAAVVDLIVGDKLVDFDQENTPEPADEDDEVFNHDDGYTLVYNPRHERVWLYESVGSRGNV